MSTLGPLRQFLEEAGKCVTRNELAGFGFDTIRRAFGGHIAAIGIVDSEMSLAESYLDGIRYCDHEEHDRHWKLRDPVLMAVLTQGMPVRCGQLYTREAWRRLPLVANFGRRLDVEPYMIAPLFGHGALAGAITFCRGRHDADFEAEDLELATVFCGFFSGSLSSLPRHAEAEAMPLTLRERQIALLAAQGNNNPEIASQLGIARETVKQALRRVYGKLGVRGRAQMAAQLVKRGWL